MEKNGGLAAGLGAFWRQEQELMWLVVTTKIVASFVGGGVWPKRHKPIELFLAKKAAR